jgi:two-component system phosphate regulon sensor histidine kinase PhoR
MQASPNGVMLLDEQGRIEWFNQTSASHFGLRTPRDLLQQVGNLVRDPGLMAYLAERDYRGGGTMPGRKAPVQNRSSWRYTYTPMAKGAV